MHSARRFGFAAFLLMLLAMVSAAAEYRVEDEEPEVTDRVARISFIEGDVQIKRSDSDDWERAVLNLPLVEGDELATMAGSRFEIQFGAYSHMRVSDRSQLKIAALKDGLVVVSLSEGNLTATLLRFDADKEAFEIDAPSTTVALLKSGRYRVDAGPAGYEAVRVSIPEEGEARIYSNNAGFSLRSGRSARIFVNGPYAGEFEHADAAQFFDGFDRWALDRDELIAHRQANSYYGKYYDADIYGADDLSDNGDWIFTRDYGYVWRPYRHVVAGYAGWSPYRYGTWRWLPGYGWAWVNDEPWGWATYHHGRWIWYSGGWHWAPYGYHRQRRSWWSPALVIIRVVNRNVCWYPLPYQHAYFNYNRHYHRLIRSNRDDRNSIAGGRASITPVREPNRPINAGSPPASSVVAVPLDDFGKGRGGFTRLPTDVAKSVVAAVPPTQDEMPQLPVMRDIRAKVGSDIRTEPPKNPVQRRAISVGAAARANDGPLDKSLRTRFIRGDRPPVMPIGEPGAVTQPSDGKPVRSTGAVARPQAQTAKPRPKEPRRTIVPMPQSDSPPQAVPRDESPKQTVVTREPARRDMPTVQPQRRSDPPPQRSEPAKTAPRRDEPVRRADPIPQRRNDPAPQKSEPKKPAPTRPSDTPAKKARDSR